MFDFNRATARYQDKQLAAHIDQISRAQAAEWGEEEAIDAMHDEPLSEFYDDLTIDEQLAVDKMLKAVYARRQARQ
ncbi:hypothetical protein [Neisseria shayeganii]|uniref:Elongation factor Ts n=1 Tax=Neisseria shayeganii 871 TaxID=1032488 RepID=G4CG66_9NEIS|nr:hypothetical protein [Neisseria shayeganii]EGY53114.1 elongation factor Ts [Neisseria shayeganii 871]